MANNLTRHVGELVSTGSRVIIVFMQIPGAEHRTLVLPVDTLPDHYRQLVHGWVMSPEGQQSVNFGEVLGRKKVEGQNKDVLTLLHEAGQLVPIAVDNVLLVPAPNAKYPMRDVLVQMGRTVPKPGEKVEQVQKRYNPFEENQQADLERNRMLQAGNLMRQASDMDAEATRLREQAYQIAPNLRPAEQVPNPFDDAKYTAAVAAPDLSGVSTGTTGSYGRNSATNAPSDAEVAARNAAYLQQMASAAEANQYNLPLGDQPDA